MTNQSVEIMIAYLFRIISCQFHQVVRVITLCNRSRTIFTLSIKSRRRHILFQFLIITVDTEICLQ